MTIGAYGEKIAIKYLENKQYKLLEKNWYCHWGELDIVMRHNGNLIFIEVKTRRSVKFGYPYEAISTTKKKKLYRSINYYLKTNSVKYSDWYLEAVCILFVKDQVQLQHYQYLY